MKQHGASECLDVLRGGRSAGGLSAGCVLVTAPEMGTRLRPFLEESFGGFLVLVMILLNPRDTVHFHIGLFTSEW